MLLIRNYPGMPFMFAFRRVVRSRAGVPGFVWRGMWLEIAEANYTWWIRTFLKG